MSRKLQHYITTASGWWSGSGGLKKERLLGITFIVAIYVHASTQRTRWLQDDPAPLGMDVPQHHCDPGEPGRRECRVWGAWGCQVITAIIRQGSVIVSHICPPHFSGDRRGGDPDLPVSTDCSHYRECGLQVIWGCIGLLCRDTIAVIISC